MALAGQRGFTLLELLVVVALMALATATVSLALRDSAQADLERDAARLAGWLEAARAQSRTSGQPVRWLPSAEGFRFEGWPQQRAPLRWLGQNTAVGDVSTELLLGPEPIIAAQRVVLRRTDQAGSQVVISTDGLRPFAAGGENP